MSRIIRAPFIMWMGVRPDHKGVHAVLANLPVEGDDDFENLSGREYLDMITPVRMYSSAAIGFFLVEQFALDTVMVRIDGDYGRGVIMVGGDASTEMNEFLGRSDEVISVYRKLLGSIE